MIFQELLTPKYSPVSTDPQQQSRIQRQQKQYQEQQLSVLHQRQCTSPLNHIKPAN